MRRKTPILAFETALKIGVTTLELDLAVTKDNILVVSHDTRLNPDFTRAAGRKIPEETGPAIRSLTFAQLQAFDVGRIQPDSAYAARFRDQRGADNVRIPALHRGVRSGQTRGADHVRFNIETKITPNSGSETPTPTLFAALFAKAVRDAGLTSRVIGAELRLAHAEGDASSIAPEIERVCLTIEALMEDNIRRGKSSALDRGLRVDSIIGGSVPRLVKAAGCAVWSPYFHNVTAAQVKEAHGLGLKVIPGP